MSNKFTDEKDQIDEAMLIFDKSNKEAPQEFWLVDVPLDLLAGRGRFMPYVYLSEKSAKEMHRHETAFYTHVIEYSAYEKLQKRIARLENTIKDALMVIRDRESELDSAQYITVAEVEAILNDSHEASKGSDE